jgi:poly(glycerol-phosphate) alpha-glucosyltransferase
MSVEPSLMRIGMLTGSVSRQAGGVFEVLTALAPTLHDRPGIELRVFGLEDADTAADRPAWGEVPLTALRPRGPHAFGYAVGLDAALAGAGLDLLHLHGLWMYSSLAAKRWSARHRAPCLVSPHGMLDPWALRNGHWKKRLAALAYEKAQLRGATCLHALCEAELEAIRAFGLINPVCVIPNGVILPRNAAGGPPPWRARLPADARVLLFLGRLHPKKGLPGLLRAWARVVGGRQEPQRGWHLVIAGWDQNGHRATLEELAGSLGIAGEVHFVGPQFEADKEASLHAADAFVLPSQSEGLPLAVLEAWAHGLPVLMTPACNLPEGFTHRAALAAEPEPDSLVQALRVLCAMPEAERRAMGARGQALVAAHFTWAGVAARMAEVYHWLLGRGPRPASVRTM